MIHVRAAPPDHFPWIAERAKLCLHPAFAAIEAVDDAGRIVGMVGYDGWMDNAVCLHIALDHPSALRFLIIPGFGVAFDKPPVGFDKGIAIATVLSSNRASIKLIERMGFRRVSVGKDWCGEGVDFLGYEMRREQCRWFRPVRRAA